MKTLPLINYLHSTYGPRNAKVVNQDRNSIFTCKIGKETQEFMILTESERKRETRLYIKDTLWAFRDEFLERHLDLPRKTIAQIQKALCEDANEVFYSILTSKGFDDLIDSAIKADGYGHFLSPYDGKEVEIEDNLYLYRIN